ncbi:GntR family transcriptional regulator [Streptomyces sp. NBC_01476]
MSSVGSRHRSLRDETLDEMRRLILDGELRPGEHLTEATITERLGVSRHPVREAFRRLEAEGLLESLPRRGVRVVQLDRDELRIVREVRLALELIAVQHTVERADEATMSALRVVLEEGHTAVAGADHGKLNALNDRFHDLLAAGGGSRFLAETLRSARNQAHHLVGGKSAAVNQSWDEHAAIIQAALDRDAELAMLLMRRHLKKRHENQGGPQPVEQVEAAQD